MRIAVLGAGAMGRLFAGKLSACHDVILMDRNAKKAEAIKADGYWLEEQDGSMTLVHPDAAVMGADIGAVDLVLVFVKAMGTMETLVKCSNLIGEHTLLMTLQNGGGHEEILGRFAPMDHVIIGTTQHNASVREDGHIFHGGSGQTVIGCPTGATSEAERIAEAFCTAGLETLASANVKEVVWRKLMTNVSLSALTGVLQIRQGFIAESENAWKLCQTLIREAVQVAAADGVYFDAEQKIEEVRQVSVKGPMGITSICADIATGRKTEVDTISGSVVRAAHRLGVPAPSHEMIVLLIHALEDKNDLNR